MDTKNILTPEEAYPLSASIVYENAGGIYGWNLTLLTALFYQKAYFLKGSFSDRQNGSFVGPKDLAQNRRGAIRGRPSFLVFYFN